MRVLISLLCVTFAGLGCSTSPAGPSFTDEESIAICETLKLCFPLEWQRDSPRSVTSCLRGSQFTFPLGSPFGVDLSAGTLNPNATLEQREYLCVLHAHGRCALAHQCFLGDQTGPSSCDPTKEPALSTAGCNGNVETACFADGVPFRHDCALGGGICGGFGQPCLQAGCADAGNGFCDGTVAVNCPDFFDCAQQGGTCVGPKLGAPFADCQFAACDAGFAESLMCSGTVAEACVSQGLSKLDCASQRTFKRCVDGNCAPTGTECVVLHDDCVDGGVQVCLDGFVRNFNCAAMGFSRCIPDAGCAL